MFDIPRIPQKVEEIIADEPQWLDSQNETIKEVFSLALGASEDIRSKIQAGEELSPRSRKLSLRKLSDAVGKSPTYLNSRDYPLLIEHINKINEAIESLYCEQNSPHDKKLAHSPTIDEMSRAELAVLAKTQRDEITKLKDQIYVTQLVEMIDKGMMDSQKKIMLRIEDHKIKVCTLEDELSSARSRIAEADAALLDLLKKNEELKFQIATLKNKPKPTLKSV